MAAVGFLGGGVIVHGPGGRADADRAVTALAGARVQGLTMAASIWVAACLGIAAGVGLWAAVLGGMAFTLAILIGGAAVESAIHRRLHLHDSTGPPSASARSRTR
ncbi:hypothetical protein tb265_18970 [Gemmatimonadetes bacterium T265]|nr:hypothetical protein tb265_18970 [Gemmatimonadetes bacterium T265]